jgi:type I restriction enzyme S subunit
MATNQGCKSMIPRSDLDAKFLFYFIKANVPLLESLGTGATFKELSGGKLASVEIPLPPLAEQKRIVALLDEAFTRIDDAKANTEACQESAKSIFSNYLEAAFQKNGPGWAEVAISELCDVKHGYAFDGADFSSDVPEGNPLIVTPGNFTEDGKLCFNSKNSKRLRSNPPAEFQFNIGDLVVVMTDLSSQMKILGKPAFVETDNLLHNQRIGKLVFSSERVDRRLVYFFMMTQRYLKNIKVTSTGTMVKHTAPKRITSNSISFPENRARQLEVITKLDELRKETQCLAKTHEDKKRALIELKSSLLVQAFAGELTT